MSGAAIAALVSASVGNFPDASTATETASNTLSTSHNVSMPASVAPGDVLAVLIFCYNPAGGSPTITTPSGWTSQRQASGSAVRVGLFTKVADGTEDGTSVDFVTSSNTRFAAHCRRVTGCNGTVEVSAGAVDTLGISAPNPDALTPSWGAKNTLWLACAAYYNDGETVSGYPSGYSGGDYIATTNGIDTDCAVATAYKQANAASENPGTFTLSDTEAWVAFTVGFRPFGA